MLERLPRPLEPDRLEILQRRHARMLDEESQQVSLRGVARLCERRHAPVTLGLIDDGVLHAMHRRMQMPAMHVKRRLLRIPIRAPEIHHHVLGHARRERFAALLGNEVQGDIDPRRDSGTRRKRAIHHEHPVVDHLRVRRQRTQRVEQLVMRRAAPAGEQPRTRSERASHLFSQRAVVVIAGVTSLRCSVG
jgi:hypothetical protein